jgi:V/A-type H+-transporting ATPase subunit E
LSLEELRRAVLEKARLEAEEIIREASERAKSIIREAEEKKKSIIEEERRRVLSGLGFEAKLAEARREARLIIARTKHEIVEKLKKNVRELLDTMSEDARRNSLKKLLLESLGELRTCGFTVENITVYVSPRDRGVVESALREMNINVSIIEDQRISGGVLVSTPGGEISIDNTYETRLERVLRSVLSELFRAE